ncbi:MAG: YibE/F family protein, partial [Clostridiales Family XIII bacterium]|nr:YibE/F family protein [Clostridiales Family XIII bacterium]
MGNKNAKAARAAINGSAGVSGITGGGKGIGESGRGWRFYIPLYAVLVVIASLFVFTGGEAAKGFINLGSTNIKYVKAQVLELDNSQLAKPEYGGDRLTGLQTVKLKLLEGEFAGRTVTVENYLLSDFYVYPEVGKTVVASVENRGEGTAPYCLLVSHYRMPGILFLLILFAVMHIVTCGVKGIHALAGLAFTMVTIFFFTIPMIYYGHSPVLLAIATGMISATVSLVLLNGIGRKTLVAVLASYRGFCFAGVAFSVCSM